MRSIIPFFIFSVFAMQSFAQSRDKLTFSASLNPSIFFPVNVSSSSEKVGNTNQTYAQYADSVRTFERYKLSGGATAWLNYSLGPKWTLQAGLGFMETGFVREQNDIQLGDTLFPGVGDGILVELSNSVKSIDYKFRYQYITLPFLFNYYVKRSGNYKWTNYFTMGASVNFLVKHEIKAMLDQFVMDGESEFHIDSTGYEGRRLAATLYIGGRFDYKVDKNLTVFAQPLVTVYPVSVSKTPMKVFPVGVTVNCGIAYIFDKKDEK